MKLSSRVRSRWTLLAGAVTGVLALSLIAWTARTPDTASTIATITSEKAPVPGPNALTNLSDAIASVARAVRPAVVYVTSEEKSTTTAEAPQLPEPFRNFQFFFRGPNGERQFQSPRTTPRIRQGAGSGFIISKDGYILTNNHVVDGADKIEVQLFDQRQFSAKVVGRDPTTDVAVIKIDANDLPTVAFGNSDSASVGDMVLAIGNPMGQQLSFTVTSGIISAKGRGLPDLPNTSRYSIQDFIQTDAAINPGNSGGPLVNSRGQVIGINSAIASETGSFEGYGFAIPINLVRRVSDELIAHGHVTRAVLGIQIRPIDQDDAAYVGIDSIQGVVVQDFSSGDSPAKQAGIRPGDVIIKFQGEPVKYVAQFQQEVAFHKPGDEVSVTVARKGGARHTYTVKLGEAPSSTTEVASAASTEGPSAAPYTRKLGITVQPVHRGDTVQDHALSSDQSGLMVTDVDPEGPAFQKLVPQGSQQGPDIITHVDGTRVETVQQFNKAVGDVHSGAVVSLRMYNPGLQASRVVRLRVH
jgi:serine protease Do